MTLKEMGAKMMNDLAPAAAGITGVYTRRASAGGGSVTLTDAVAGNSDYVSQPAPGEVRVRHDFNTRTILVPIVSLVINGAQFTPDVGDTWAETINGTDYVFEVLKESGKRAVTFCDSGKTRVRIRMKRQS